jgi:AAA+ ATPase superfamily predicted ATPase
MSTLPFVGRKRQLEDIHEAILDGKSVLLVGGRRVGKTRLLAELRTQERRLVVGDVSG